MQNITPEALHALRQQGQAVDLIDVRTPAEYNALHAEDAVLVPLDTLNAQAVAAARKNPQAPLYVICQSGGRSVTACRKLEGIGMSDVVNVLGGTSAWHKAGLPVVADAGGGGGSGWKRATGMLAIVASIALAILVHPAFLAATAVAWIAMAASGRCPLACALGARGE